MSAPIPLSPLLSIAALLLALTGAAWWTWRPVPPPQTWPDGFTRITLEHNNISEAAWYYKPKANETRPLLLSLHSWSGNADQYDPLAALAQEAGWHYIHPDFGGANTHPDACLSETALDGMDVAIDYALAQGGVDPQRIFVAGESGGGYAALGSYLKSQHTFAGVFAWVPITDLVAWHTESQVRRHPDPERRVGYDADIRACTGSADVLDTDNARARSPLWMTSNGRNHATPLLIAAGLHDGHDGGTVPVSHSVFMFNRLAQERGEYEAVVREETLSALLNREVAIIDTTHRLGARTIYLERRAGPVRLVIFEGGHESLPGLTIDAIHELAQAGEL